VDGEAALERGTEEGSVVSPGVRMEASENQDRGRNQWPPAEPGATAGTTVVTGRMGLTAGNYPGSGLQPAGTFVP
jgi:orotidine-5'-phosphate decarboxylase